MYRTAKTLPEADADQNFLEDEFGFRETRALKGRRVLSSIGSW